MGQLRAIGQAQGAAPLASERTKKCLGATLITLVALAALAGAIYGGISLASHNFTLFGETGTLALTIASGIVILGLCIGGVILYRRSKQNVAPSSGNDPHAFTSGSSTKKGTSNQSSPYELKPRIENRLSYKSVSPYLGHYEYLCDTRSPIDKTYYFSDYEISRIHGQVSGTNDSSGFRAKTLYDLDRALAGKTQVTFKTVAARAKDIYQNDQIHAVHRIQAQHILYEPLSMDHEKLLPQLSLSPKHFSYVITEHAPFDGASKATSIRFITADESGKISASPGLRLGSCGIETTTFKALCQHIQILEGMGLTFMPHAELIARSNLK